MNTRELINFGHARGVRTVELPFDSSLKNGIGLDRENYSDVMTFFMNQGVNIDRTYIEIRDDDLSLTLHGSDGNMMQIRVTNVITSRMHRTLPVSGDFMIEAVEDRRLMEQHTINMNRTRALPTARNQGRGVPARDANSGVVVMDSETSRGAYVYNVRHTAINSIPIPPEVGISIGISSMSIPIIARATKGNFVMLHGINTNASGNDQRNNTFYCPPGTNPVTPEIPLTYHMGYSQSTTGYNTRNSVSSCNLISRMNTSLVKECFPSEYDSMRLKVLAKMPSGTLQKAVSKIKKSEPFGKIQISLDHTEEGGTTLFCYVTNEKTEDDNTINSVDKSTDLTEYIVHCDSDNKTVATMSYPTWMDNCKTTRQRSLSFANIANRISPEGQGGHEEFVGINDCNNLVYGVIDPIGNRYLCTIETLETDLDFDIPEVIVKKATKKRVARDILVAEVLVVPEELDGNPHYTKWKVHSDAWHNARILQCPVDLAKVFTGFINSGEEVTEEDITEFGRLNS